MEQSYTVSYGDSNSILIINAMGRIRTLYTPFRVICRYDYMNLQKGVSMYVDEVVSTPNDQLLFITNTGVYAHSHFTIVASF